MNFRDKHFLRQERSIIRQLILSFEQDIYQIRQLIYLLNNIYTIIGMKSYYQVLILKIILYLKSRKKNQFKVNTDY